MLYEVHRGCSTYHASLMFLSYLLGAPRPLMQPLSLAVAHQLFPSLLPLRPTPVLPSPHSATNHDRSTVCPRERSEVLE